MGKWDLEIARAKKETIDKKVAAWKNDWTNKWCKEHKNSMRNNAPEPPSPPKEVTEVKSWFIAQWDTGFCVVDMKELMKRPKKQRDKILKLGGL